ncbi:hypothetical protein E4V01_03550 [Methylorubrum sp. Q1]|nr:hypothetical protein [Methylorubrum sp. Q1]TFZ60896.1 hypothetical protein E4V01_03550 [Methylorubrum sp. Q1]
MRVRIDQTDLAVSTALETDTGCLKGRQHRSHLAGLSPAIATFQHRDSAPNDTSVSSEVLLSPVQEDARGTEVPRAKKIEVFARVDGNVHFRLQGRAEDSAWLFTPETNLQGRRDRSDIRFSQDRLHQRLRQAR